MTTLETKTLGISTGTTNGIIKLQKKALRKGGFKYRAIYSATGHSFFNVLDLDIFELSYPSVHDKYVI